MSMPRKALLGQKYEFGMRGKGSRNWITLDHLTHKFTPSEVNWHLMHTNGNLD